VWDRLFELICSRGRAKRYFLRRQCGFRAGWIRRGREGRLRRGRRGDRMRNWVVCVLVGFIVCFKEIEMDLQDGKTDCYGPTTTDHEFVVNHPPVVHMSARSSSEIYQTYHNHHTAPFHNGTPISTKYTKHTSSKYTEYSNNFCAHGSRCSCTVRILALS